MRKLAALIALLLPLNAWGVALEVCGSGLDEPGNTGGTPNGTFGSCPAGYANSLNGVGCDLLCPGADQDNDGYTSNGQLGTAGSTAIDCDDTNKFIFPGAWTKKGCTGGQIHQCHATNGTYSSCVSPSTVAQNTGVGSHQYWIDCVNGNDTTGDGSYTLPFKTFGKVSGGSGATGLPASPVTLAAGDAVIVKDGSTPYCSSTIQASGGGQKVVGILSSNGTALNPITVMSYDPAANFIYNTDGVGLYTSQHYRIIGLGFFTGTTTQPSASGIRPGTDTILDSNYFAGMLGDGNNNDSCIYAAHTNGVKVRRNILLNCKRTTGNVTNISAVKWLDDDGGGGGGSECQDHEAYWNGIVFSTLDDINGGGCFYEKHGCLAADVGANNHPVRWNSCVNGNFGLTWQGSKMRASDNVFVNTALILGVGDGGESGGLQDNQFTNNSVYIGTQLTYNPTYLVADNLLLTGNVIYDTKASYVGGNNEGIYSIASYDSAGEKATFESVPYRLTSNSNCFYNPNTAPIWAYFNQGDSSGLYNFTNWKLRAVSYDALSFVQNPVFDSFYQATSANCVGKGRIYAPTSGGSTGTTGSSTRFFLKQRWRTR